MAYQIAPFPTTLGGTQDHLPKLLPFLEQMCSSSQDSNGRRASRGRLPCEAEHLSECCSKTVKPFFRCRWRLVADDSNQSINQSKFIFQVITKKIQCSKCCSTWKATIKANTLIKTGRLKQNTNTNTYNTRPRPTLTACKHPVHLHYSR